MNERIIVGVLVGLVITSSLYIWNSEKFNKLQKTFLLFCILFPPLQWLSIFALLFYKRKFSIQKNENSKENNDYEQNAKILKDLRNKSIISENEFNIKMQLLNTKHKTDSLIKTKEYQQLNYLLKKGILTQKEFDDKIESLVSEEEFEVDEDKINEILKDVNKNFNKNQII